MDTCLANRDDWDEIERIWARCIQDGLLPVGRSHLHLLTDDLVPCTAQEDRYGMICGWFCDSPLVCPEPCAELFGSGAVIFVSSCFHATSRPPAVTRAAENPCEHLADWTRRTYSGSLEEPALVPFIDIPLGGAYGDAYELKYRCDQRQLGRGTSPSVPQPSSCITIQGLSFAICAVRHNGFLAGHEEAAQTEEAVFRQVLDVEVEPSG